MLAARAGGAEHLHLDVAGVDLDLDVLVQLGHHFQAGKARLAAGVGVKRADTHQAVHAVLAFQHAVGVRALHHHRSALDARLVAVQHVQHLHAVAVLFGPAGVHAVQHLGPVLRLGAAGPGVEGQDCVAVVVLAVEHRHQLQLVNGLGNFLHRLLALFGQRGVVLLLDHLQQRVRFLILGGQLAVTFELVFQLAHLAVDLLAAFLVVEKAGHGHLVLQLGQALLARFDRKRVPQIVHSGPVAVQAGFQFVNRDHIAAPVCSVMRQKT